MAGLGRNKSGHAISRMRLSEAFCPSQRAMCLPIVPPVPPVVQWRFFGVQDRHEAKRPTLGEKHSGESHKKKFAETALSAELLAPIQIGPSRQSSRSAHLTQCLTTTFSSSGDDRRVV